MSTQSRAERMIKMDDMIMDGVGRHHQVADILGVEGHFHLQGVLD